MSYLPDNEESHLGLNDDVAPVFDASDEEDDISSIIQPTGDTSLNIGESIADQLVTEYPDDVYTEDSFDLPSGTNLYQIVYLATKSLDSYDPFYLSELHDAGAVFYAVYDDDSEVEVSWDEVTPIDATAEIVLFDNAIANAINQHFWSDTNGVHVSEIEKDNWDLAVSDNFSDLSSSKNYYNILMNSLGLLLRRALYNLVSINRAAISFYDGLGNESSNIMASFGRNSAQVGRSAGKHIVIDNDGITAYDGDNVAPLNASNITAAEANIQQLQADTADISTIRANSAKVQSLTAEALTAATAYIAALNTASVTANDISANKATIAALISGNVTTDTLRAASAYISSLVSSNISASTLTADHANLGTVIADYLTSADMEAERARVATLIADYATVTDLNAATARIGTLETENTNVKGRLTAAEGNITTLTSSKADITDLNAATARIGTLETDNTNVKGRLTAAEGSITTLTSSKADITDLNAATARIGDLEADHVSVSDFEAEQANIDQLQADTADISTIRANSAKVANLTAAQLEADHATVGSLSTTYATISNLNAATGRISDLESTRVRTTDLEANYITADAIEAAYTKTDLSNTDVAWIQNGTIKNGAITNAMINSVSANKLTAGTIDASVINVTNLQADDISVTRINGQTVSGKTLVDALEQHEDDISDLDTKIDTQVEALNDRIDGAIETFTGTAVPTLTNSPASSWNTTKLKDQHVGDVYYVVNSNSQQNGYCYRFTKSGSSYSWQLIKDSDVTAALGRLQTAEGKIGTIEQFDSDISSWKTDTDEEIASIKSAATTLAGRVTTAEGQIATKVETSTFNTLSQTVDENSASISQLTTETTTLTSKVESQNPFIVGTQTAQTGNWTGNASTLTSLVDGQQIIYWLPFAGSGNASLNLTLKDGTTTGAIPCYYGGTTRLTTHYAANNAIHLTYRTNVSGIAQGWWADANYDTNTPYTKYSDTVVAGKNGLKRYTLCMKDDAGNFTSIVNQANNVNASGKTCYTGGLQLESVCYHSTGGDYAAGANAGIVWESYGGIDFRYSVNGVTNAAATTELQLRKPIYLVGTIGADGLFYLDTTKWWTQTSFVEDKAYVFVGTAYSSYCAIFVAVENPTYIYEDGELVEIQTLQINKTTTKINTVSDTVDEHTRKIGLLETSVESKADGSTVETMSTKLNTVSDTVDGHTQSISSINNTLSTKADSSTVSTLSTKVNTIEDTVDGHTQSLQSVTSTQTSIQQNAVKSTVQLWFTKANTSAPVKPTAHVTTNNAATANAWNLAVPTYNASYPNYYYCYEYQYLDGSYGWSAVTRDIATGEMQERARTAITNAANAQADIDGLEIGGRNLALNTAGVIVDITNLPDDSRREYFSFGLGRPLPFGAGTPIVISFDLYMPIKTSSPSFRVYNTNNKGPHQTLESINVLYGKNLPVGSIVNERIIIETSVAADRSDATLPNDYLEFYSYYGSNNYYRISNLKLEKGNRATDWTPAPEDIDADISTAQTAADTAQATADKNVKESIQLWITKASSSTPTAPTSKVTSTAVSGNAWTTKVPTYNSTYPYYFYCMQYVAADGTVTWSDVVYDQATTEAQSIARTATTNLSTLQQDYATFKQTTQNFESTIGSTYATKTELQTTDDKIENLQIGGRNLYILRNAVAGYIATSGENKGGVVLSPSYPQHSTSDFVDVSVGDVFTFQMWNPNLIINTSNSNRTVTWYDSDKNYISYHTGGGDASTSGPKGKAYWTWTCDPAPNGAVYARFGFVIGTQNSIDPDIKVKVERGNKPTDWTPAPEDVNAAIEAVPRMSKINMASRSFTSALWKTYGTVGRSENWTTGSSYNNSHLRVGDRAYVTGTISDKSNGTATIIGEITDVQPVGSGTSSVTLKSEQLIFGGDVVDAIESRVTNAETSITQTNNQIALKANASDVYTKSQTDGLISTEVSNRNSAIEQSAAAINLSVSQNYTTKTEFNNLEIGGRGTWYADWPRPITAIELGYLSENKYVEEAGFVQDFSKKFCMRVDFVRSSSYQTQRYCLASSYGIISADTSHSYPNLGIELAANTGRLRLYSTSDDGEAFDKTVGTAPELDIWSTALIWWNPETKEITWLLISGDRSETGHYTLSGTYSRKSGLVRLGADERVNTTWNIKYYQRDIPPIWYEEPPEDPKNLCRWSLIETAEGNPKSVSPVECSSGSASIEAAKSEIKATTDGIISTVSKISSAKYLVTTYSGYTLNQLRSYATEGYTGGWQTTDAKNSKPGDTVYLKVKDTTRNCYIYVKATVLTVTDNYLRCTSHGYEDVLPVDTIKSTINQSSDSVKIQANHVEIDGAAIFSNTAFKQAADAAYDAKGSASAVQTNLDNLEIGGRNLLRDSSAEHSQSSSSATWFEWQITDAPLETSQDYTFSFDAKTSNGTDVFYVGFANGSGTTQENMATGVKPTTVYGRMSVTARTTKTNICSILVSSTQRYGRGNESNSGGTLYIKNVKLEKSNKATDWSPAPEDVTADISTAESSAKSYADTKKSEAISAAASDATTKANAAETNAKSYSDTQTTDVYERIRSQGIQLVTNGNGFMGDNTNFSWWTFDGSKSNGSPGSFTHAPYNTTVATDEMFPVDTAKDYIVEFDAFSTGSGANPQLYAMLLFYDVDKNSMTIQQVSYIVGSTTTLARELKNGDTVIYLTDVSGFIDTSSAHQRSLIFWDYTNSFGYTYPPETYSRNFYSSSNGLWSDYSKIDKSSNTIALTTAWTGGTKPAGTYLSQNSSGSTYAYFWYRTGTSFPLDEWTHASGIYSGFQTGIANVAGKFYKGCAYCKIGWLWNYQNSSSNPQKQIWITNVSVKEAVATKAELDSVATTANAAAPKTAAVSEEQHIYRSVVSGTTSMAGTTSWVTIATDTQNAWTTKRPTYNSSYPVLFVAKQRKTVSGTVTCTTPVKDDTTTVIDGGHITTGTIDADRISSTVVNAINANVSDTINADKINVSGLTIGYSQLTNTPTIPSKVSDLTNDSGYQTSSQVNTAITSKGYQTSSQVETAIASKGYATTGQAQGYATTAETNAKSYADDVVDSIDIGGRNLLRNTADPILLTSASYDKWVVSSGGNGVGSIETVSDSPVAGLTKSFRITNNTSGNRDFAQYNTTIESDLTGSYRFSVWVRGIGGTVSALIRSWNRTTAKASFQKIMSIGTDWTYLDIDFDPDSQNSPSAEDKCDIQFGIYGAGSIEYIAPKLEKGNKATDWTPAPEDQTSYVDDSINNLEIGGRNLLRGTAAMKSGGSNGSWSAGIFRGSGGSLSNVTTSGFPLSGVSGALRITNTGSSSANIGFAQDSIPGIITGETYTESGWIRASVNMQGYLQPIWYSASQTTGSSAKNLEFTTDWKWFSFTGEVKGDQANLYSGGYIYAQSCPSGGWFEVCGLKLEKSTKPTDWSPAPEDVSADISTVNSSLTTEINQRKAKYGTCSTTASDATKMITCSNYELVSGNELTVKFSTANTSAGKIQFNVNGKGAKDVWVANAVTSATNQLLWGSGAYITVRYDGTQFIVIGEPRVWYGASTTAAATAAKTDTTVATGCVICKGTTVNLHMTYANSVANPTLNIASTGAKAIYSEGSRPTATGATNWSANATVPFIFDGQYWKYDSNAARKATAAYNNAEEAKKTATNYITADTNGIKIHMSGNNTTYQHQTASGTTFYVNGKKRSTVGADGLKVYIGDTSGSETDVASFGTTARIGSQSAKHLLMRNTGVTLMPANGESSQQSLKNISDFFVDQDTYLDDPLDQSSAILTGLVGKLNNLLSTPSGLVYSVADNDVLIVTEGGAQVGSSSNSHLSMDYHSLQMVDKDGDTYFHVSDLRDASGVITEYKAGPVSKYVLGMTASDTNYSVSIRVGLDGDTDYASDYTITKTTSYVTISPAITAVNEYLIVSYTPADVKQAKAYTFGIRRTEDSNAIGGMSVAEGCNVLASGTYSHAEGWNTKAFGKSSHAEGQNTYATGEGSHAEGYANNYAVGESSHAEGSITDAYGKAAHSEGRETDANGDYSHAEGQNTVADGIASHSAGYHTNAKGDYQTVIGRYNVVDNNGDYAFIVGVGYQSTPINGLSVDWSGNLIIAGGITLGTKLADSNLPTKGSAGTAGTSSATSGATLAVPYITTDAYGRVTAKGTHTHTIGSLAASAIGSGTFDIARIPTITKAKGGTGVTAKQTGTMTLNTTNCTQSTAYNLAYHNGIVATVQLGFFTLKDALANGSTIAVGTVPSGFRPAARIFANVAVGNANVGGMVSAFIGSDGAVSLVNRSGASISTSTVFAITATYCI